MRYIIYRPNKSQTEVDVLRLGYDSNFYEPFAKVKDYDAAKVLVNKMNSPNLDPNAAYVKVARELLPELEEWSNPVRIKVVNEEGQVLELLVKTVT